VRIKLDENLGRPHVALLKRHGHEADRVFDQGLSGIEDAPLWARVRRENLFFITLDLGFSDIRRYAPGKHPGLEYCSCARAAKRETQWQMFYVVS
jgi:predicted nuclease of predicted toxin-antitoxin system